MGRYANFSNDINHVLDDVSAAYTSRKFQKRAQK